MKNPLLIGVGSLTLLIAVGLLLFLFFSGEETPTPTQPPEAATSTTPTTSPATSSTETIGMSVEGRAIEAYTFGSGEQDLLFVGGIHGGYEWNSIMLAFEMIDSFNRNQINIPDSVTVHIIPNLNPDGLFAATGMEGEIRLGDEAALGTSMHAAGIGRFNANDVDLNRNFACKWAPESSWRGQTVSAGTSAFSEPEARALRTYVSLIEPEAAIFWHSQAGNVYGSECENGPLPETLALVSTYAEQANYGEVPVFDAYPITGDAEGWLASIGIPAITVEMETRTSIEWTRNLGGVEAVLMRYAE